MFALSSWFREGQLPNSPRPQGGMWTKGVGTKGQRPDLKTPGPTPSCRKEGGREGGKERPAIVPSPTLPGRWRLELVHPVPGGGLCPQLPPFFAQQVPRAWVCLQGAPWLHLCPGWLGLLVDFPSVAVGPERFPTALAVNFPLQGWRDHLVPGVRRLNLSPTSASHCLGTPPC